MEKESICGLKDETHQIGDLEQEGEEDLDDKDGVVDRNIVFDGA